MTRDLRYDIGIKGVVPVVGAWGEARKRSRKHEWWLSSSEVGGGGVHPMLEWVVTRGMQVNG